MADADVIILSAVRGERTGFEYPPLTRRPALQKPTTAPVAPKPVDGVAKMLAEFKRAMGCTSAEVRESFLVRQRNLLADLVAATLDGVDGDKAAVISLLENAVRDLRAP